ncbi:hypothetical protein TrVE_jg1233 [Triparma verrucosa]|uniref:UDENN domain-containing protein n=1 Tax=Triparma verrucosa TaxID=1606542 RepID=A0A9W7FBQ9_9STRA|nr:hypothetical protein TrVE_jg1233 [Triparma verrucosa]
MSDSGLLTLGICCSDIDYGRSHVPLFPPPALTIWLQTRYTNQLIRVGEESKVTVDRYDFDESFVRVRLLCGGAPTSSFDSSLYSLSSTSLPVSSSSKIKEPQTSPTSVSKKNQRRKQRRTSLVRAQSSVAATPSPPLSRNGPASDKPHKRRESILLSISALPGFEKAAGTASAESSEYWAGMCRKLEYFGSDVAGFLSTPPDYKFNMSELKEISPGKFSLDGVKASFLQLGECTVEAHPSDSWVAIGGDGFCVKLSLTESAQLPPPPPVTDEADAAVKKPNLTLPPVLSPAVPSLKKSASSSSAGAGSAPTLPSGVIASFTVLSPKPLPPQPPPDEPTWIAAPEQEIVSSYPKEAGIEKLEWFLPSNPVLLSPSPPDLRLLSMHYNLSNVIDFSTELCVFLWTTISCGPEKNYIGALISWVKVCGGGESYGGGVWAPVTMCMVTQLPIIGAVRRCLVRLKNEMCKDVPVKYIRENIRALTMETPSPIAGVLNVSVPFMKGPSIPVNLPHPNCLPPLPHGNALTSTLRLLHNVRTLNMLLGALFTEQKLLFVSRNPTVRAMVCETLLALVFPCVWSFVVIPILPDEMGEFIQAPVPYILGVPKITDELADHVGPDVVVYNIDEGRFVGEVKPSPLPEAVGETVKQAWNEMHAAGGFDSRKINYTEAETKLENRFRVTLSLALSNYIKRSESLLELGPEDPSYQFTHEFAQTQMFSNLVDRVDSECVFFHDLLDLLEITSGDDREAVNAGVSVLKEYGKNVEMFKVVMKGSKGGAKDVEEGEDDNTLAAEPFSWVIRDGGRARTHTEEDTAFILSVANAAAERAAQMLKQGGTGSERSLGGGGSVGDNLSVGSPTHKMSAEEKRRSLKKRESTRGLGGGLDSSIDFSFNGVASQYTINGVMDPNASDGVGSVGGEGGDQECGWTPQVYELRACLKQAKEDRERKGTTETEGEK